MNLPVVLDVALGLIFIYLTLSLLASEIQELIGTVLQWRAEHLKNSIEVLLSGNAKVSDLETQVFANQLYDSPWIRSLNQEAKGQIARSFRAILHKVGDFYRWVTQSRNVFGQNTSGPSYIPSEAFANSLLQKLSVADIKRIVTDSRVKRFVEERLLVPVSHVLNDLRASTANEFLLNAEFKQFEQAVGQILVDFQEGRISLANTLDRLLYKLEDFTELARQVLPENHHLSETFLRRLTYLRAAIANNDLEKSALLQKLRPTVQELLTIFDEARPIYRELVAIAKQDGGQARELVDHLQQLHLPTGLKDSLISLADKTQARIQNAEEDITALGQEIETWFNRGMERAAGVYRRNAKAVALIIGIGIAIAVNADTIHMATRLAVDPLLRDSIGQVAVNIGSQANSDPDTSLDQLEDSLNAAIDQLPLPLGYDPVNLEQQQQAEDRWPLPIPLRVLGWIITGVAISMGANFWFDLLKKVVSVRTSAKETK